MRTLTLLFLALLSGQVAAVPITGLFNTGVDNAGTVLAGGANDPHYSILSPSQAAVVINNPIPGSWLANDTNSKWIWETSSGTPTNVTRTFRHAFDLSGFDLASVIISGRWSTDNVGDDILINGVSTSQTASGFSSWFDFSVPNAHLVAGQNTIDFVVRDVGVISGFRAEFLRAEGELASSTAVAEPASLALLLFGLGGLYRRPVRTTG